MTNAQLADALADTDVKVLVAKILLHDTVREHLALDRETAWACAPASLHLHYVSKVERLIEELRAPELKLARKRIRS